MMALAAAEQPNNAAARVRVLMVEDDLDAAMLATDALSTAPQAFDVVHVTTGEAALAKDLKTFDVVALDYRLPDIRGLELLEKILGRVEIPVVMVTGENDLELATAAIEAGAYDYVVKVGAYHSTLPVVLQKSLKNFRIEMERRRLNDELSTYVRRVEEQNSQLEAALEKIKILSVTDPLTGVLNRRQLNTTLALRFHEAQRYELPLAVIMLDVDNFKTINDRVGHVAGDQALVAVAAVLRETTRQVDFVGRYGGDEFVVGLPHTPADQAAAVAERIRTTVIERTAAGAQEPLTVSLGIACSTEGRFASSTDLVSAADSNLLEAKRGGRNRLVAPALTPKGPGTGKRAKAKEPGRTSGSKSAKRTR
ncbi:MAG: diguanylate cyclase [Deltaproteobacteria bacterium]|nr:diguanylate cyclase [Deltaproteobacteria bacterium]